MRTSPLKENFLEYGAIFYERYGCEVVKSVKKLKNEYDAICKAIGISDFSYMHKFSFSEENGFEHLSNIVTEKIEKIDYGSILNTYLLDNDGNLIADCYIIRGDGEYILLCESIESDDTIRKAINVKKVDDARDLTDSHFIIGIDGYKIKEIIEDLFGKEALELPPLTAEKYCVNDIPITLLRASKFTNSGYLIMAPIEIKNEVFKTIIEAAEKIDGFSLCGIEVQNILRIEENLFNIFSEGRLVKTPILLGLDNKIDLTKEKFTGKEGVNVHLKKYNRAKRIRIQSDERLEIGMELFKGDEIIGIVIAECFSFRYKKFLCIAIVKSKVANENNLLSYKTHNGKIKNISILNVFR